MRVLLCGEGPHDIGLISNWSIRAGKQVVESGWLQPLLEAFLGEDLDFVVVPRRRLVSLPGGNSPRAPLPKGHGAKALIAKLRAASERCDMVVFMLDADTSDRKEWSRKRAEVLEGFASADVDILSVACVPLSASESWLLADKEAWAGLGLKDLDALPARPEELWGQRDDPQSDHPHCRFARVCETAEISDSRETRVALMKASNLATLEGRCPVGFGAFAKDIAA